MPEKRLWLAFLTACDVRHDADGSSALWGNPRILKLTRISCAAEKNETEPTAMKGLVIRSSNDMESDRGADGTSVGVGELAGAFPKRGIISSGVCVRITNSRIEDYP